MSELPVLDVVAAAIIDPDVGVLVTKRGPSMSLPGVWEFPGGKTEPGESPRDALAREIAEELGLIVEVGPHLATSLTPQTARTIRLSIFAARIRGGALELREHADALWLDANALLALDPWAEADVPLLPAVVDHLAQVAP